MEEKNLFAGHPVINLLFCSHEEFTELILKIREKEKAEYSHAIVMFPGMKYGSAGIQ